jgi:SH3-like domain-containing protein
VRTVFKGAHGRWAGSAAARARLAAVVAALALSPLSSRAEVRSVRVATANFRTGPSVADPILYSADRHYPVELLEQSGDWARVRDFEGDEAWVAAYLLGDDKTAVVAADVVNIREKPLKNAVVVHTAERGAVFLITERRDRWVQVADDEGVIGWVHESLLWGDFGPDP